MLLFRFRDNRLNIYTYKRELDKVAFYYQISLQIQKCHETLNEAKIEQLDRFKLDNISQENRYEYQIQNCSSKEHILGHE